MQAIRRHLQRRGAANLVEQIVIPRARERKRAGKYGRAVFERVAAHRVDAKKHGDTQPRFGGNALQLLIGQPLPANLPPALPLGKQVAVNALPVGMSSEVLLRRPDIRQSEYQLQAANANIGAARAAFFPRISLTGSFGSVSRELDGLFTGPNMAWSFMPQISLPIFDFGRNQSNLDLAHARKNIAVAQYEKSIQGAFREVADQLAARRTLADQLAAQERGYQAERERLRLVQMRYDNGISSSLDLLDAQRQSYALEQALLLTRQAAMNNRIDLYKVLGGGLVDVTAVAPVSAR